MAWISFQASEELQSHSNHGFDQSPTVKATDTLKLFCCHVCERVTYLARPFGTTCELCEGKSFEDQSISSMADSRVRTFLVQEMVLAWQVSEADFICTSKELSLRQSQLSSSLKTSLQSGLADLVVWCGDFPRWGMICDGQLFLPQKLELRTKGTVGSVWLPTPAASMGGTNQGGSAGRFGRVRPSLETMARKDLWPTPKASDSNPCGMQAMLRYNERTGRKTLITEVAKRMWPTPRASDASKGIRTPDGAAAEIARKRLNGVDLPTAIGGGALSPMFVEWLMGYRIGWTELNALETAWFRNKRAKRSSVSRELGA